MSWTLASIPDLTGRTYLVTGVTSGIGRETALVLAENGARVVLAARAASKLASTRDELREQVPDAEFVELIVDLADLSSVRRAAGQAATLGPLDVLINNAGVMATPSTRTVDGLELQMATNHFGPFLLTGLLLPQLVASGDGRVVTVSSLAHRLAGSAPLTDPHRQVGRYRRWPVYAQSKLANLLFTYELDRRLRGAEMPMRAVAAHPGYSATHLLAAGQTGRPGLASSILDATMKATAQPARFGALPTLMAATADVPGSTYVGPGGPGQVRGLPQLVGSSGLSRDRDAQRRLWEISEEVASLDYLARPA